MPFYNPYHFVPVDADGSVPRPIDDPAQSECVQLREKAAALRHVSHEAYVPDTHSGRIVCRLETKTPTFVGTTRDDTPVPAGGLRRLRHFELPGADGTPALPASSLRGMVSAVAEAASNSALRVLEDRKYSRRVIPSHPLPDRALSAVGFVSHEPTGWRLTPLALPAMRAGKPLDAPWRGYFPAPAFKVYLDNPTVARAWTGTPDVWLTSSVTLPASWDPGYMLPPGLDPKEKLGWVLGLRSGRYAITPRGGAAPATAALEGDLLVLDGTGLPHTRTHELFLPVAPSGGTVNGKWQTWGEHPIPSKVVADFEELAAEAYHYQPAGRAPLPWAAKGNSPGRPYKLRSGDLVYFDVATHPDEGGAYPITEIALSAIWRRPVKQGIYGRGSAHAFFHAVSPELLPFNRTRTRVTLAERVFGVVAEPPSPSVAPPQGDHGVAALRGRVRFSHGALTTAAVDGPYLPAVPLKALVSPKPPSPALYFKRHPFGPQAILKKELEPGTHRPQGRKFYLHQDPAGTPWRTNAPTDNTTIKSEVRPQASGNVFHFHVDFDNLTNEELGLLCYALQPSNGFMHKLGMGKALGLGSVEVTPLALCLVPRQQRYDGRKGFLGARYGECAIAESAAALPEAYKREREACQGIAPAAWAAARQSAYFASHLLADANQPGGPGQALAWLGRRPAPEHPVHWPRLEGALDHEKELFKWFVINEQRKKHPHLQEDIEARRRALRPIGVGAVTLDYNPPFRD